MSLKLSRLLAISMFLLFMVGLGRLLGVVMTAGLRSPATAVEESPAIEAQEKQTFALACAGRAVARAQLGDLTSDYHERFFEEAEISAVADGENIWRGAAAARVDRLNEKYRGPGLDYACHQLLLSRRASR